MSPFAINHLALNCRNVAAQEAFFLSSQIKLDPVNDDIAFLDHSEPHLLARSSVRIVKREAAITTGCPRTACMSRDL